MALLKVKDPIRGLLKASDQIGSEQEWKGASCKVRASSANATVFYWLYNVPERGVICQSN